VVDIARDCVDFLKGLFGIQVDPYDFSRPSR
jgi:hypothetical protein